MATSRRRERERQLRELLTRDHTLNGGILFGLDGYVIEVQARAMEVLRSPTPWPYVTDISGMAGVAVREATQRIAGAFAKLRIPEPEVCTRCLPYRLACSKKRHASICPWRSSCNKPGHYPH
jgi:magnesium chelatase family protein